MIDMQLFLTLMGAPTYSDRLSEDEKPAFLDNRTIDEQGIKAMSVEAQTFQLLTEAEREQVVLDEDNSSLSFPCSLAEFRSWIINNGYQDIVDWENLKKEHEANKILAKLKGERLSIRISGMSIDEICSKDIRPAHGNFDLLAELYCWRKIIENKITELSKYRKHELSTTESLKVKLTQKIQKIDQAINSPITASSDVPANQNPKDTHRENELHRLINHVDQQLQKQHGKRPSYKTVWNEIEKKHLIHDKLEIIDEVTKNVIFWTSSHGNRSRLNHSSFSKTLSIVRKKYGQ